MTTYYTVTVDTEESWDWDAGFSVDAGCVANIQQLERFDAAVRERGAVATYFTDYSVVADAAASDALLKVAEQGSEIGLHIHPWNTPPFPDREPISPRNSFLHNLPRDLALAKLETVFTAFKEIGIRPQSFRGGRYSTSDWIQQYLCNEGILADASILPMTTWQDDGAPDYRSRDTYPRRLDYGGSALWEIPLTIGFTRGGWPFWKKFYELASRSPLCNLRLIGVAEKLLVSRVWLNLENFLGEKSLPLLHQLRRMQLPCINITMHSSSLVPGGSPYSKTEADVENLYDRLNSVLGTLQAWPEFKPATVSQLARILESENHADTGN